MISSKAPEKKTIEVLGRRMAYIEMGQGDPVVFQHGNPTSSYLWRNIMPHVAPVGRCIAVDLIGMGDSEKLDDSGPGRYRFVEHREFLDAALAALGVESNVTWVMHDWGSALGFDWANRHRDATKGLAYTEAIVRPLTWEEWPEKARRVFQGFRSEAGEQMVLENNVFVERVLPGSILRDLTEEEMTVYRAPYARAGRVAAPDADLASRDPDRRHARGRDGSRPKLCRMAEWERSAEAVRQRRARRDPDRRAARVLPRMEQSG